MAKQTNSKKSKIEYSDSYKHGNFMMISTMIGMCSLLIIMLLSTAFKTVNSVNTAFAVSKIVSVVFFLSFIVTGALIFKKDKSYVEYCVYSIIMSIGFLALGGTSAVFFLPKNVDFINSLVTTRNVQMGLIALNIAYIIWAFIYHGIKSEKKI